MAAAWESVRRRLLEQASSPLNLMREMLMVCEENLGEIRSLLAHSEKAPLVRAVVAQTSDRLPRPASWPAAEAEAFVASLLDAAVETLEPLPPVAAVRAVAEAIDAVFGDALAAEYARASGARRLTDNDLVVAPDGKVFRYSGSGLGPRPGYRGNHPNEPGRLLRCSLFHPPVSSALQVIVDTSRSSALGAALAGLPVAATVHPVVDHVASHDLERVGDGVFGLGPRDGRAAWEQTMARLEEVARLGAQIAVVPELNVAADITMDLTDRTVPALVLCGSRHVKVGEKRLNEATLFLNGRPALTHHKVVPFAKLGSDDPSLREAIDPGDTISVLYCGQWAVVALICADVNSDSVVGMLRDLGVNLLLVASMSRAIGYFPVRMASFVEDCQGLAVWANDPLDAADVETSAFCFPSKYDQVRALIEELPAVHVHAWPVGDL